MKQPTIHSPFKVEVLMHCHCHAEPHPRILDDEWMNGENMVRKTIEEFLQIGVIYPDPESPNVYRTTRKGRAWVEAICNTPVPREMFVDEIGRVINA